MRRMLATIAVLACAACAAAEEYKLTLDPKLVITPLPELAFEEPSVLPTIEPPADLPLPPLDLSEAIGFEKAAETADRIQADAAEPVWTPPEQVGVSVRPVAEIREEAAADAGADEASFRPVLAYQRGEEDLPSSDGGVSLRTEEGLVPKDVQNFVMPPPDQQRGAFTFHIERSDPDPFADFSARVRRPRR